MNRGLVSALALAASLGATLPAHGQAPRKDFIWARSTEGAPITLDGVLDEPAWALAESVVFRMAQDTGIPGSGYFYEAGIGPIDPTNATLRFLTVGNQLYMGAYVRDHSVGGSNTFNRFDGLLMAIKDHLTSARPAPPSEYFYSWWYPEDSAAAIAPGAPPRFRGRWTGCNDNPSNCPRPRTAAEIAAWNAVTTVGGISNDDNNVDGDPNDDNDWGYVVEMRFDLGVMGYNVTKASGDTIEWNCSVYDCDWLWPFQPIFSANRVWWQNPWGNDAWFHNVRILARPDVTIYSSPGPPLDPDFRVPAADNFAAPAIDGLLSEPVWQNAPHFDIRYSDDALRASYPGEGPWRSGQLDTRKGDQGVLDPGDATVRWFFKGDKLYLGFDVRDQIVQYDSLDTKWDGFIVSINDYAARSAANHQLIGYKLSFQVGPPPTGAALPQDELPPLISASGAQVALHLKAPSPLDTLGRVTSDVGYSAEMWIDLTKVGYPVGRGDGRLFLGVDLLDGDSFTPWTDSYGTRTWWQRQLAGGSGAQGGGPDGPGWGYLDPGLQVVSVDDSPPAGPATLSLLGARPNPFRTKTALHFTLARPSQVSLRVFDTQGRLVAARDYGAQPAGPSHVLFGDDRLQSGLYLYRLRVVDGMGGASTELAGKMMLVR